MPDLRETDSAEEDDPEQGHYFRPVVARVTNIIATANLNYRLDLSRLEQQILMAQYFPHRFSALLIRILEPFKCHGQLYANGKLTVNGAKSEAAAYILVKHFSDILNLIEHSTRVTDFKVVNVVGTCDYGSFVKLKNLSTLYDIDYCPELFPGMRFKLKSCVGVLFHSGRANFLSGKTEDDIQSGCNQLRNLSK